MRKSVGKTRRTIISLLLALSLSATALAQVSSAAPSRPANDAALQRLEREIARLAAASGGVVGVTAIHLETGRRVSMNGSDRFPMASTFKVPVAVQLLTRIDKGEVKLDQMIEIEKRNPQQSVFYVPALIWEHIDLNLDNEWLKDKRVRQAIAHSINRDELSTKLFYGKQPVAHTWLPERHEGFNSNVKKYAYDPARARQLLAEAGFTMGPDGIMRDSKGQRFEISIMTTAGNASREQVEQIIKEQMRAVGIDLKIDNRPASVLFGQVTARRLFPHMVMYAWLMAPTSLGNTLWHSSQIPTAANNWEGQNGPGWKNADNDKLLDQITNEIDAAKRVALLKKEQEIWADELPAIPLYFRLALNTANKKITNVKPTGLSGTYINWNSQEWAWSQ